MVFTLNCFNDLGRCAYGTLKESIDTEKDIIYLKGNKVEINCLEDLFPFLWQASAMEGSCIDSNTKVRTSTAHFYSVKPWWHNDYDPSIIDCDKEIEKLTKKIAKGGAKDYTVERWRQNLKYAEERKDSLKEIIARLDAELEEQKLKLIEENKK